MPSRARRREVIPNVHLLHRTASTCSIPLLAAAAKRTAADSIVASGQSDSRNLDAVSGEAPNDRAPLEPTSIDDHRTPPNGKSNGRPTSPAFPDSERSPRFRSNVASSIGATETSY